MAIWMDDQDTDTQAGWRGSDLAMMASLAVVALLQVAVVIYMTHAGGGDPASGGVPATFETTPGGTEFAAAPATAGFDGQGIETGLAFWFRPGSVVAHVDFTRAASPLTAPRAYVFRDGAMELSLYGVPVDYRETEPIGPAAPETEPEVASRLADAAPATAAPAAELRQLAALRDYLGEDGMAAMSTRCAALLKDAYRYDGGMVALCRKVNAIL